MTRLEKLAHPMLYIDANGHAIFAEDMSDEDAALVYARSEIARLDALSRATADDPEDVVPCVPCGKVECECGDARDEMENA
jgi:hypothetical protein